MRKTAREGKKWVLQRGPRPVHRGPFGFHEHLSGFCCEPSLGPQVLTRSGSGVCVCACLLGGFSRVQLFETPWVITCQSPLIMGSSRQECWSGLPCPPPGDLPHPGMEPVVLMSPALAGKFFTTRATWQVHSGLIPIFQKPHFEKDCQRDLKTRNLCTGWKMINRCLFP